ncbi:MAG: gliding motility protein GldM [Bacteroidetes bacterium]|jgi:gliding motility-associated protein GldM|nr:gliding motility protein GldM [Bacteroidota bacterium]
MAGGKGESPRQKMIGMMYLVLTALLAMNVSKDILKAFVTVNDNLERTNKNFDSNTKKVLEAFKASKESNPSALPYYEKAEQATKITKEIFDHISKLKQHIIDETEKMEKKDTLRLKYANAKDNYDAPTHIMIGDDETNPKDGDLTAKDLRKRINAAESKLQALIDDMQKEKKTQFLPDDYKALKEKISTMKVVDPNETEDGAKITWEIFNFYHLPLAGVVTNLTQMQSDIKNVESELVSQFSGASGKIAIKFNQLSAKVVAPSSYIQMGQPYKADIFLAASSTDFKDDNMQVIVGVDSAEAAKGATGAVQKLEGGMGKYEVGTGGQGLQTYKGVIKFKKPTGEYDYYPFSGEYMVAAPSTAIALDKMNVFYIGVPNPVSVSAAGVSPTDLVVNANGGGAKYVSKGGGKYEFTFSSPGDCNISVSAKTKDGTKPQGPPIKFRVKRIPDPVAKIGGKIGNGILEFKKLELASIGGVIAEVPGFEFDARFVVKSFIVSAVVKGSLKEFNCAGNNLSAEAKGVIQSLSPGSKLYFENIKASGPDGSTRTLPNVSIKVK